MENPPVLSKVVAYIVFGFIFTGFCLLLSYIITLEVTDIADIPKDLEMDIFIQRFLNNPECFAYEDREISRVYPGVIDLEKFKQENLDKCYKIEGMQYVPGFKLKMGDKEIKSSNFEFSKQKISKDILIFKDNNFEMKK